MAYSYDGVGDNQNVQTTYKDHLNSLTYNEYLYLICLVAEEDVESLHELDIETWKSILSKLKVIN